MALGALLRVEMKKLFISLSIITIVSVAIAFSAPINETFKGVAILPAVGSLSAAIFQIMRDYASEVRERTIWLRDNRLRAYSNFAMLMRTYGHSKNEKANYMAVLAAASEVELLSSDPGLPEKIDKLVIALNAITEITESSEYDPETTPQEIGRRLAAFNDMAEPIRKSLKNDITN